MTESPISLDTLISFVIALHPDGSPLENLSDAISVSTRLDERADSLIGHFVDQARRSGASWNDIGTSMGVSKQAAQKRFVFRWDDETTLTPGRRFSRFTDRARRSVAAAQNAARDAGASAVDVGHLVVGLLSEPEGLAAIVIHEAGVTDDQLRAAFMPAGATSAETPATSATPEAQESAAADRTPFTEAAHSVLEGTLHAALRLGHNYIGTEHILLSITAENNATTTRLANLGITADYVDQTLPAHLAKIQSALANLRAAASTPPSTSPSSNQ